MSQSSFNNDPSIVRDPTGYKVRYGDKLQINVRGLLENIRLILSLEIPLLMCLSQIIQRELSF